MKKTFRRIVSTLLASAVLTSSMVFGDLSSVFAAQIKAETEGWKETAFTEWLPVDGTAKYEAYVKSSDDADYTKLDDELIRQYNTYCRADAMGLKAGSYSMKIVALDANGAELASYESQPVSVAAYKRTGFAFADGTSSSGGYNNDGTPESGAKIFYITNDTKDTITMDVVTSNKGTTTACTGMGEIIKAREKGYDNTPLIFRFIGEVDRPAWEQSLNQIDIKRTGNITFEGVGSDTVTRFGFNLVEASDVEVRNLGFMDMTTKDEDAVTIKDESHNVWIHNIDVFYGGQGSDKDQAKGDGGVDLKGTSTKITVSDNHYWDFGKVNLCGLGESADYNITYSGNWFDHSDSRHPRIRRGSIHIYNNYYDGNAKYGVGITSGGSGFVEANYFRNCKYPVLISLQGSDGNGDGTFSGENGGILKMYNNIMAGTYTYIEGTKKAEDGTKTYEQWADGYSVDTRNETLPSSLVCSSGSTAYNNFDTTKDLGVSEADILAPADVPAYVMANAGREMGGNFVYDFKDATDDESYDVNSSLVGALSAYENGIIKVGGTVTIQPDTTAAPASMTGVDGNTTISDRDAARSEEASKLPTATEEDGNKATGGGGTITTDLLPLEAGTYDAAAIISDTERFAVTGNKGSNGALKIESGSVKFAVNEGADITITYKCGSSDSKKSASISCAGQSGATLSGGSAQTTLELTDLAAGSYAITATQSGGTTAQIMSITVTDSGVTVSTESTSETTTESTSESTTESTSESSTESTESTSESTTESTSENTTEPVSTSPWGEADGNGTLTANDAAYILGYVLTNSGISDERLPYCDVNGDDKITASDAALVLQRVLEKSIEFPAEEKEKK